MAVLDPETMWHIVAYQRLLESEADRLTKLLSFADEKRRPAIEQHLQMVRHAAAQLAAQLPNLTVGLQQRLRQ